MDGVLEVKRGCGGPTLAVLRAWHCRELDAGAAASVAEHVRTCEGCSAIVSHFERDQRDWEVRVPLDSLRLRAAAKPRRLRKWWLGVAAGGAFAAAASVVVLVPPAPETAARTGSESRSKGGPSLSFHVRTPSGSRPGVAGEALGAGDQLRLAYEPGGARHVLVVLVDADGAVSPVLASNGHSVPVSPSPALVPDALELDDDPRPERVVAVFSDEPVELSAIEAALARRATSDPTEVPELGLPGQQASLLIRKKPSPTGTP